MRRTVRPGAVVIVVALLLTVGCSSESDGAGGGPTTTAPGATTVPRRRPAGTVDVTTWAKTTCADVASWETDLATLKTTAETKAKAAPTLADLQKVVAALYDAVGARHRALAATIRGADRPDLPDGKGIVADFTDRLDVAAENAAGFAAKVRALDPASPTFLPGLKTIQAADAKANQAVAESFEQLDRDHPGRAFQDAMTDACG